ncbi:MAG: lipid-A-disaccharide synthase [Bosea sp. (in: a-proteobacteria)]
MTAQDRTAAPSFRLFIVAGEASGDNLAAHFIEALQRRLAPRRVELMGIGGPVLQQLGLKSRFAQTDIQLMGIVDVLKSLPTVLSRITETAEAIEDLGPDLLLTVDVPDFSMRVAKKVRRNAPNIPIIHWVAPTVWAWRPGRAKAMKPHVDRLLALLPFEPEVFRRLGGPPTTYVGHPLLDVATTIRPDKDEQRLRDNAAAPVILVLPGSRRSEIKYLLPVFRDSLRLISASYPHARFVIPAVPHLAKTIADNVAGWGIKVEVVLGEEAKRAAFRRARVALAASGTVTLELAVAGIPLVGAYRGQALEAWLAGKLVTSHSVLMCNLVLQENIAPEYMQNDATAASLASAILALLADGAPRHDQIVAFQKLDAIMALPDGQTSGDAAVDVALQLLDRRKSIHVP